MDRPRDYFMVRKRKSEGEKHRYVYMWNLEKRQRQTYLRSRDRDTEVENNCMANKGKRRMGWIGRLGLTYTHYYV